MKLSDIPKVRVVDEKGKTCYEGYYFEMPERQGYPINDGKPEKIPIAQCVVVCMPGDWGLPNTARLIRVTSPHKIEIIRKEPCHEP